MDQPDSFFNGRGWESADHRWRWDGTRWRALGGSTSPLAIRLSRGTIVCQAAITGVAAAIAFLVALILAVSGPQWILMALAVLAVGAALAGLAGLLVWLGFRLDRSSYSRILVVIVEVLFLPVGFALSTVASQAAAQAGTPTNPGTDGPFVDGGVGVLALMGAGYVFGAVVVICALGWNQIRLQRIERQDL